jgi:DNA mismatch endonuclease (patch repair protein)
MSYIRDKRSPKPSSTIASKVMSAIKAKNTKPEILLRKLLAANNVRGYRLHWNVEGKPDLAFVKRRIAVFLHGCYWHRCPHCDLPVPKSNTGFWLNKFQKNVTRDACKAANLRKNGWLVLTVWECKLKKSPLKVLSTVKSALDKSKL